MEVGLYRVEAERYQVELRFNDPASEAEIPPERGTAALDLGELLTLQADLQAYGESLTAALFHAENVRGLYLRARSATEAGGGFLRLRLRVGASAMELHALRWELLVDPESKAPLATSERTLLSRFMVSQDWRPVRLRPKANLKALIAVAAPRDLDKYHLAEIDLEGEIHRARASLAGVAVEVAGQDEPLTLERLTARLRGGVDVLYLVCHGVLIRKREPYLLLQDEAGDVARIAGEKLAEAIAEMQQPPRLVVLASCESAGTEQGTTAEGKTTAEASLAPRLAEAGVPAVVAMQGKISMETVEAAMPIFFSELLQDGQIDRALAVARAAVRERHDRWMPALYLRLKRGCIWYVPGFSGEDSDFAKWRSIALSVRGGSFIPIVGPSLSEDLFGPSEELPIRLGEEHDLPLPYYSRTDLAKVAQYLSVRQSRKYAREKVVKQLHRQLLDHHPELAKAGKLPFPKLLDIAVERAEKDDPMRILAGLPASIYITSSLDPLLLKHLKAAGREPVPLLCEWRPTADNHPREPVYEDEPTRQKPVVYHVFGLLGKPDTLVLTEDDFFDNLLAVAEFKLIPSVVRGAMTRNSLIFLGFRLDLWRFRVLFRLIMNLGGSRQLRDYAHVGVQVDPEELSETDVEEARKYLEQSFSADPAAPPLSIYWGSAADFLKELLVHMESVHDEEIPTTFGEDEDDWLG